jgi:hypothetical protein
MLYESQEELKGVSVPGEVQWVVGEISRMILQGNSVQDVEQVSEPESSIATEKEETSCTTSKGQDAQTEAHRLAAQILGKLKEAEEERRSRVRAALREKVIVEGVGGTKGISKRLQNATNALIECQKSKANPAMLERALRLSKVSQEVASLVMENVHLTTNTEDIEDSAAIKVCHFSKPPRMTRTGA